MSDKVQVEVSETQKEAFPANDISLDDIDRMGEKDLLRTLELVEKHMEAIKVLDDQAKSQNPFYFFEPSTGDLSEKAHHVLRRYLKPDDIPQKFDSQTDVFRSDASIIGAFGGNQVGKTTTAAIKAYMKITGEVPDALKGIVPEVKLPKKWPVHVRVVGEDYQNGVLKTLLPTFRRWAPRDYLYKGEWEQSYSAEQRTVTLVKDGKIFGTVEFMSNEQGPSKMQGPPRHMIIYDEQPDYDVYEENLFRFTTADTVDILFTMTPTKGMSWVHDRILRRQTDERGRKIECFKMASVTNKYANYDVLEEILDQTVDYNKRLMRLLGEFVSLGGLIYGNLWNRRIHVIPPFSLDYGKYTVYRGLDPHTSKDTFCVESAFDREGTEYAVGCWHKGADTEEIKAELAQRATERNYRLAQSRCDTSANTTNKLLGDRNIFLELGRGKNAIPALFESQKFKGSIDAGVDQIKQRLKVNPYSKQPTLFVFGAPEMEPLITAFETMERLRQHREEVMGIKDKINEGPHDAHAAFRYIHQGPTNWIPVEQPVYESEPVNDLVGW